MDSQLVLSTSEENTLQLTNSRRSVAPNRVLDSSLVGNKSTEVADPHSALRMLSLGGNLRGGKAVHQSV